MQERRREASQSPGRILSMVAEIEDTHTGREGGGIEREESTQSTGDWDGEEDTLPFYLMPIIIF